MKIPSPFPSPFPIGYGWFISPITSMDVSQATSLDASLISPTTREKRRREIFAGRAAARRAIVSAGGPAAVCIPRGSRGEPVWPPGWCGSISHSNKWVCAAAAPRTRAVAIGVDIEDLGRSISDGEIDLICAPEESSQLLTDLGYDPITLFSAKETVYKMLFPLTRIELNFRHIRLTASPNGFEATIDQAAGHLFPPDFRCNIASIILERCVLSAAYLTNDSTVWTRAQ